MLSMLLLCVWAQGRPIPGASDDKLDAVAWTAGQLETVVGMKPSGRRSYGLYTYRQGQYFDNGSRLAPSGAPTPIKKGAVSWTVSQTDVDGQQTLLFESEGTRNIVFHTEEKLVGGPIAEDGQVAWGLVVGAGRKVWLDAQGHTLKETYTTVNKDGTFFLSADFKPDDEVEVTMKSLKGEKHFTLHPVGGRAAFDAEFQPMLAGQEVVVKEKSYVTFDPVSGGLLNWHAEVGPRFNGTMDGKPRSGRKITLTCGKASTSLFVDDGGELLQVELPDKTAIILDSSAIKGIPGLSRVHFSG